MRERRGVASVYTVFARITPARAGKTTCNLHIKETFWDHPRSCGKDAGIHRNLQNSAGSPPLVRERLSICRGSLKPPGITPARAGKTPGETLVVSGFGDHPRSCGKDMDWQDRAFPVPGSPPLVRERQSSTSAAWPAFGITPARAGKTGIGHVRYSTTGDHPRSCGKDCPCHPWGPKRYGSPPLVRERRNRLILNGRTQGITPARAGKTGMGEGGTAGDQDHPRSCGKDNASCISLSKRLGSPPLVRERPIPYWSVRRRPRITPARAGKTFFR